MRGWLHHGSCMSWLWLCGSPWPFIRLQPRYWPGNVVTGQCTVGMFRGSGGGSFSANFLSFQFREMIYIVHNQLSGTDFRGEMESQLHQNLLNYDIQFSTGCFPSVQCGRDTPGWQTIRTEHNLSSLLSLDTSTILNCGNNDSSSLEVSSKFCELFTDSHAWDFEEKKGTLAPKSVTQGPKAEEKAEKWHYWA